MTDRDMEKIKQVIKDTVKETVNGKIDAMRTELSTMRTDLSVHNTSHQNDMERILPAFERIMPVVEAFEEAKTSGKRILKIAGFITALGSAVLMIKDVFFPN